MADETRTSAGAAGRYSYFAFAAWCFAIFACIATAAGICALLAAQATGAESDLPDEALNRAITINILAGVLLFLAGLVVARIMTRPIEILATRLSRRVFTLEFRDSPESLPSAFREIAALQNAFDALAAPSSSAGAPEPALAEGEPPAAFLQALVTSRRALKQTKQSAAALAADQSENARELAAFRARLEAFRHWVLLPRLARAGGDNSAREIARALGADIASIWRVDTQGSPELRAHSDAAFPEAPPRELLAALETADAQWEVADAGARLALHYRTPLGYRWILSARFSTQPAGTLACEVLGLYCLRRCSESDATAGLPPLAGE